MAKKKKKHKHGKHGFRNAGLPRPRGNTKPKEETPLRRLGYTAAGAAGTALIGSFLATQGWAPKRSEERRVGKECRSRWSPYH